MKNIVVEGARGLGKSSVTRYLREKTTNSTLINFTGFNEGGVDGKIKVIEYYNAWFSFFSRLHGGDYLFIHDRFFFSEMVYSKLYKDYDFSSTYLDYTKRLPYLFEDLQIVLLWTDDMVELGRRLVRDKEHLFGEVMEDVTQSLLQQSTYMKLLKELQDEKIRNVKVHLIWVDGKTVEQIGDEILALD